MKQIPDSLGIFGIILVSLYNLYLFGVGNDNLKTVQFEDEEYGKIKDSKIKKPGKERNSGKK